MEKIKNIPSLRFPEFNGEWNKMKLGEICEIVGGGTPDTNIPIYWGGEIQWFTPTEIKFDFVSNSIRTITELGLQKSSAKKLPIGTILLTTRATIGEVSIALNECSTNQGFQSLIVRKENSNIFIFNWIKQNKHELTSRANGSTFPEISKTAIEKIFLNIPTLPEQQKIASFLSAVDEKIQQLSSKKVLLEQYKKGVMQQLFSGKLRFRDENGKDYPDWEVKRLKDIVEKERKIRYGIVQPGDYDPFGRFMIRGQDYSSVKGWAVSSEFFKVSEIVEQKYIKARVKSGDLLITIVGAGTGWLEVVPDFLEGANITQTTGRIAIDKSIASPGYVKNYFFTHSGRKEINSYIKGQAQPGLNIGDVEIFKLPLPCIAEQQKIADLLLSIDTKIESTSQQINKMQSFKKGLLQQMFC